MTDHMKYESNRQDLAGRIVTREVYYCASYLVTALSKFVCNAPYALQREEGVSWDEDILPLLESYDIEQAVADRINECEDPAELENMAELNGWWSEAQEATGWDEDEEYDNGEGERTTMSFEDWFQMHKETDSEGPILEALHAYISKQTNKDDWEEFCTKFSVDYRNDDTYRREVYEHWIISDWLARKLAEKGEVTGELFGLTLWGRCTTGQSIALDYVVQQIAMETWPEDVVKPDPTESEGGEL